MHRRSGEAADGDGTEEVGAGEAQDGVGGRALLLALSAARSLLAPSWLDDQPATWSIRVMRSRCLDPAATGRLSPWWTLMDALWATQGGRCKSVPGMLPDHRRHMLDRHLPTAHRPRRRKLPCHRSRAGQNRIKIENAKDVQDRQSKNASVRLKSNTMIDQAAVISGSSADRKGRELAAAQEVRRAFVKR
jgi:hypothetical protein